MDGEATRKRRRQPASANATQEMKVCLPCKLKKKKCDKLRPWCFNCVRAKCQDECVYEYGYQKAHSGTDFSKSLSQGENSTLSDNSVENAEARPPKCKRVGSSGSVDDNGSRDLVLQSTSKWPRQVPSMQYDFEAFSRCIHMYNLKGHHAVPFAAVSPGELDRCYDLWLAYKDTSLRSLSIDLSSRESRSALLSSFRALSCFLLGFVYLGEHAIARHFNSIIERLLLALSKVVFDGDEISQGTVAALMTWIVGRTEYMCKDDNQNVFDAVTHTLSLFGRQGGDEALVRIAQGTVFALRPGNRCLPEVDYSVRLPEVDYSVVETFEDLRKRSMEFVCKMWGMFGTLGLVNDLRVIDICSGVDVDSTSSQVLEMFLFELETAFYDCAVAHSSTVIGISTLMLREYFLFRLRRLNTLCWTRKVLRMVREGEHEAGHILNFITMNTILMAFHILYFFDPPEFIREVRATRVLETEGMDLTSRARSAFAMIMRLFESASLSTAVSIQQPDLNS